MQRGHSSPGLRAYLGLMTLAASACSEHHLTLGKAPDAGSSSPGSDGAPGTSGDGGSEAPILGLDAGDASLKLQLMVDGREVAGSFNLPCSMSCVDAEVRIEGGIAPYLVAWSDGIKGPTRRLCRGDTYQVTVTDAGRTGGEFERDPLSSQTSVSVLPGACEDAGVDATVPVNCRPVSAITSCGGVNGDVSIELPGEPLQKGKMYTLRVDMFVSGNGSVEFYGGSQACAKTTPLFQTTDYGVNPLVSPSGTTIPWRHCESAQSDANQITLINLPGVFSGPATFSNSLICDGCPELD